MKAPVRQRSDCHSVMKLARINSEMIDPNDDNRLLAVK